MSTTDNLGVKRRGRPQTVVDKKEAQRLASTKYREAHPERSKEYYRRLVTAAREYEKIQASGIVV